MGLDRERAPDTGHPAPGLPSPAPGHCRLRVRGHAVKTAARPVPFAAWSRNPPGTRAPPASSCGHSHVGNRCVVTHLCRDLPPPGFQRARHFARLVERGQSQGRRQRGAVVHRPRFGDRSVTPITSGLSRRLHLPVRAPDHAAADPGRSCLPQADGTPPEVDRRKNRVVSHTSKGRVYAATAKGGLADRRRGFPRAFTGRIAARPVDASQPGTVTTPQRRHRERRRRDTFLGPDYHRRKGREDPKAPRGFQI